MRFFYTFALIIIVLVIIAVPITILVIPSEIDILTEKSWCVEKIYFKGNELIPNSTGLKFESQYDNCSETMQFYENGTVIFPGINTSGDKCIWTFKNDSLIVTEWEFAHAEKLKKSIFLGTYNLEIKNKHIKLQSDSLTILGKEYKFDFKQL